MEIVRIIMALAQSLRMKVVAEGIENRIQLAYLRQMGCEFGQGYYFYEPLDTEKVERLLAARSVTETENPQIALAG